MDSLTIEQWGALLGFLGTFATILAAAVVKVLAAVQETHREIARTREQVREQVGAVENKLDTLKIQIDGHMTNLLKQTARAEHAEGVEQGRGEVVLKVPDDAILPGERVEAKVVVEVPPQE